MLHHTSIKEIHTRFRLLVSKLNLVIRLLPVSSPM